MCGSRSFPLLFGLVLSIMMISTPVLAQCDDADGDGYCYEVGCLPPMTDCDCNDQDPAVNSASSEVCDGFDNDCDGRIDNDQECNGILTQSRKVGGDVPASASHIDVASHPSLAWNGAGYGLAWYHYESGVPQIYFGVLDPFGRYVIEPRVIAQGYTPRIIWTGTEYGLAMRAPSGLHFVRVDSKGSPVGAPLLISTTGSKPDVAWNGTEYGVVWREQITGAEMWQTKFAWITAEGVVGGEVDMSVPHNNHDQRQQSIVWNGTHFGVTVFAFELLDPPPGVHHLYFVLLERHGTEVGDVTVVEEPVTPSGYYPQPGLTWSGDEFGVWWEGGGNIYLTRLTANGDFVNPADPHANATADQVFRCWYRDVAWTGAEYGLLHWCETFTPPPNPQYDDRIKFVRVSPLGAPEGDPIVISSFEVLDWSIVTNLLAWSGREFGVVWMDYIPEEAPLGVFFTRVGNDADLDNHVEGRDCDDADPDLWSAPGAARDLLFSGDKQTLNWVEPEDLGGTAPLVTYDTLRSGDSADFSSGPAICLETDDSDTQTLDTETPATGGVFSYLVRGENICGEGSLGLESDHALRTGRECP